MSHHIDTECDDGLYINTKFLNYHHSMLRICQFRTITLEVFKYNHSVWNSEENPKGVCGRTPWWNPKDGRLVIPAIFIPQCFLTS